MRLIAHQTRAVETVKQSRIEQPPVLARPGQIWGPCCQSLKKACNVGQIICLCPSSEKSARGRRTAAGFFNQPAFRSTRFFNPIFFNQAVCALATFVMRPALQKIFDTSGKSSAYVYRRKKFASQESCVAGMEPAPGNRRRAFSFGIFESDGGAHSRRPIIPCRCIDARGVLIAPPSEPCCSGIIILDWPARANVPAAAWQKSTAARGPARDKVRAPNDRA